LGGRVIHVISFIKGHLFQSLNISRMNSSLSALRHDYALILTQSDAVVQLNARDNRGSGSVKSRHEAAKILNVSLFRRRASRVV